MIDRPTGGWAETAATLPAVIRGKGARRYNGNPKDDNGRSQTVSDAYRVLDRLNSRAAGAECPAVAAAAGNPEVAGGENPAVATAAGWLRQEVLRAQP